MERRSPGVNRASWVWSLLELVTEAPLAAYHACAALRNVTRRCRVRRQTAPGTALRA